MLAAYYFDQEKIPDAIFLAGFTKNYTSAKTNDSWRARVATHLESSDKRRSKVRFVILNSPEETHLSKTFEEYGWERLFNRGFKNGGNDLFVYRKVGCPSESQEQYSAQDFESYPGPPAIISVNTQGLHDLKKIEVPTRPLSTPICCGSKLVKLDLSDDIALTEDQLKYYKETWMTELADVQSPKSALIKRFIKPGSAINWCLVKNKPEKEVTQLLNKHKYVEVYAGETHKLMFSSARWQDTETTEVIF